MKYGNLLQIVKKNFKIYKRYQIKTPLSYISLRGVLFFYISLACVDGNCISRNLLHYLIHITNIPCFLSRPLSTYALSPYNHNPTSHQQQQSSLRGATLQTTPASEQQPSDVGFEFGYFSVCRNSSTTNLHQLAMFFS